jgi:hypothetical protein
MRASRIEGAGVLPCLDVLKLVVFYAVPVGILETLITAKLEHWMADAFPSIVWGIMDLLSNVNLRTRRAQSFGGGRGVGWRPCLRLNWLELSFRPAVLALVHLETVTRGVLLISVLFKGSVSTVWNLNR